MGANSKPKTGQSSFPCQTFNGKEYHLYNRQRYYSRGPNYMHQAVWVHHNGPVPEGKQIHHINGDPHDNRIENLTIVSPREHMQHHMAECLANPEYREKMVANLDRIRPKASEWHGSPEGIEWHRQHAEKHDFGNLTYGQRECAVCGSEYEANTTEQTFCSNKCKSAYRRKIGIDNIAANCELCGKEFQKNKYARITTCSRSCGVRVGKLRRKSRGV